MKLPQLLSLFVATFFASILSLSLNAQSINCNILPTDTTLNICQGEPLELNGNPQNGSMPYTHLWYGDSIYLDFVSIHNVIFISNTPGTYILYYKVTDNLGDTAIDSINIIVQALPVLSSSGDTTICMGQSVTLSASGANTIIWFDEGDNLISWTPSTTVSPNSNTFYTIVGITNGCSNNKEVNVNVLAQASVNAGSDDSICAGSVFNCIQANASDYSNITWSSSGDGSFSDPNILNPSYLHGVQDLTNGTVSLYIVAQGNGPCPDVIDSLTLVITQNTTITITGDTTICEGDFEILTCTTANSYLWSTGESIQSIIINPLISQTYSVTVTIGACTTTDDIYIEVFPIPTANAGNDSSICLGDSIMLSATEGTTYLWSTGGNTQDILVNPITSQTYTVTVSENGCSATDDITISVLALPIPVCTPDTSICKNESLILNASGGIFYSWSTGETGASISINPLSSTTYYVTVSNGQCEAIDSILVTVKALPIVNLGPDTTICTGDAVTLCAGIADTYLWNAGCIAPCIVESPIDTTTYSVTATLNGCSASDTICINILPYVITSAGPDQNICIGDSATLIASGGTSYIWSTGDTTQSINVNPLVDQIYYVTATLGNCTGWDQVVVLVNSPPTANAGPDVTICYGDTAILTASGGISYTWSTGDSTANTSVSPLTTSTYYVTVSDGICSATDSTNVTITPLPLVNATDTAYTCPGSPLTLNVNGANNYIWEDSSSGNTFTFTPNGDTIIYVTGYDNGCSAIDSSIIVLFSSPHAYAGPDLEICEGDSILINALGHDTFLWSTGETNSSIWVNPTSNSTYYLTVTLGTCYETDSVNIIVHQNPNSLPIQNQDICLGDSVLLSSGGGDSYLWSTGDTTAYIYASPVNTSNYTLTVYNSFGCSSIENAIITVHPIPIANAGFDKKICFGDSVILCANGGGTYTWNTGATSACISVSPNDTLQYYVDVYNGYCQAADSITVYVLPLPIADAGNNSLIIQGDTAYLNGNGNGTQPLIYSWIPPSYLLNPNDSSTAAYPDTNTIYTLFVTDNNGCTAWDTTSITVYPPNLYTNTFGDTAICSGDTTQIMVEVYLGGQAPYTYSWTPTTSILDPNNKHPYVFPSNNTMYYVNVTDSNGISTIDSVYIQVYESPNVNLGNFTNICDGDTILLIDNNIGTKLWSTGATGDSIYFSPSDTSVIYLTVINNSCIDSDTLIINVNPMPAINAGPDQAICFGDSLLILNFNGPINNDMSKDFSYELIYPTSDTTIYYTVEQNGCISHDELHITVLALPVFDINSSNNNFINGETVELEVVPANYYDYTYFLNNNFIETNYDGIHYFSTLNVNDEVRVVVSSIDGCISEKTWAGNLNDIPNAFTPNANGSNDLFMFGYKIKIVNRWGQLIYEGENGWDGTYNGENANSGTYYYIISLPNPENEQGHSLNGSILLIR